jgi:ribose 5-phosphate isomerase A
VPTDATPTTTADQRDPLAAAAVAPIEVGMVVGLGTGRAASRGIRALAHRVAGESLDVACVATSAASAELARSLGLRLLDMADVSQLDYLFDGADEVDAQLRMLKGGGGAMTREKIVAHAARRRVYMIQAHKRVDRLGERMPLPIEVLPFARSSVERTLTAMDLTPTVRTDDASAPVRTDEGNLILETPLPIGTDVEVLAKRLDATPGVVGHGLFVSEADEVLVEPGDDGEGGNGGTIERLRRNPPRS